MTAQITLTRATLEREARPGARVHAAQGVGTSGGGAFRGPIAMRCPLPIAAAIVASAFFPAAALAYTPGPVERGGTIAGTVRFLGTVPPATKLAVTKDESVCGARPPLDESLAVSPQKGLQNAIVHIGKIERGKPLQVTNATLENRDCRYEPHVQAVAVGSELAVRNADPILHNTHIRLPQSDVFNYALPVQGQVIKKRLARTGLMKVGCDAGHTWMSAWIAVFDHPYFAVTDKDGRFQLGDVPPGDWVVQVWHEKLGAATVKVTLQPGASADASHAFK